MRLKGWINIAGDLEPAASKQIRYLQQEQEYAVVYAPEEVSATGEPLFFSQTDIRQYLETKAAAHTMVECLMEFAGVTMDDISRCYLSGAFSAHSDLESAITIGMFPDIAREKYQSITNTSLAGAREILLDNSRLQDAAELMESIYCMQFASVLDFTVRMQAAKFIPHTDMDRYPTVKEKLQKSL